MSLRAKIKHSGLLAETLALPKPLHDRILVRRIPEDDSHKLIVAPGIAKEKPLQAEVLAVGPGKWRHDEYGEFFTPTQVKPGMRVMLSPSVNVGTWPDIFDGTGITMVNERDILLIQEGDCLGVME